MAISIRTHKMLWGRAANRCAFPDCRRELVEDRTQTDDEALIGEECHMVAESPNGPRGDGAVPEGDLDKYGNLLLLCRNHHTLVDQQRNTYSLSCLQEMKRKHEEWVRLSLKEYDPQKQRDDEVYAFYIDEWLKTPVVDDWRRWTSQMLSADLPHMSKEVSDGMDRMPTWLFGRVWPGRYPVLEAAFHNFRMILSDLAYVFHKHAEADGEILYTKRFYHIDDWDPPRYERLLKTYSYHVALVGDLTCELARAGNLICVRVRQYCDPTFRMNEGVFLVQSGPYMDMTFRTHRLEYEDEDTKKEIPYPGLEAFRTERRNRDFHFGEGKSIDDPGFWVGGDGVEP